MDDLVRQAMAKWPHVPDCYGWLGLDSRGQWHMRDDRVQALGSFQSGLAGAKGSVLRHEKLIDFIHRNYEADAQGRWYFQNGPQRVYVELETTPLDLACVTRRHGHHTHRSCLRSAGLPGGRRRTCLPAHRAGSGPGAHPGRGGGG